MAAIASTLLILGFFVWKRELDAEDLLVRTAGFSLLGIASSGLILAAVQGSNTSLLKRSLRFWPIREIGKYSYGFYVYHVAIQPSLKFLSTYSLQNAGIRPLALAGLVHLLACFVVCLAISILSWNLLEKPFLQLKRRFE